MNLLATARELAALAQTGAHYTKDPYDAERYGRLAEIAAEMMNAHSDAGLERIRGWARENFGYATPKVDVRAFVPRDGKVLLIRENSDGGRWTLPGGWADVNETPSSAVARETLEESGYEVRPLRLLAVLDREKQGHTPPYPYHIYKMFFHCEITGGEAQKTLESSGSAFFGPDELPELSVSRVLPEQIRSFFEALRTGDAVTRFD